ncbi:hypothetical protein [Lysobacter changpingensis]|uniref:hypothetical protein n=1 Tax=Lysobacter changpingensis TaxID=2792784 RepID=UPI001A8F19F6|nr:hypothetical protein [Lysobacter changpingensis]
MLMIWRSPPDLPTETVLLRLAAVGRMRLQCRGRDVDHRLETIAATERVVDAADQPDAALARFDRPGVVAGDHAVERRSARDGHGDERAAGILARRERRIDATDARQLA